jgi:hypothetical protein
VPLNPQLCSIGSRIETVHQRILPCLPSVHTVDSTAMARCRIEAVQQRIFLCLPITAMAKRLRIEAVHCTAEDFPVPTYPQQWPVGAG